MKLVNERMLADDQILISIYLSRDKLNDRAACVLSTPTYEESLNAVSLSNGVRCSFLFVIIELGTQFNVAT